MSECQQCGEPNVGGSRFCVVCGAPIPQSAPSAGSEPVDAGTGRPHAPENLAAPAALGEDFPLDGPPTIAGFLVSYEGSDVGQYWPICQGRNVVGREGAVAGLDVEIAHPTTSSRHAVLLARAQPGRVVLEDAQSTNGTFVNDNPLSPGQRWELRDGDRVRFGLFESVIKIV